jgi:hypothetical protein
MAYKVSMRGTGTPTPWASFRGDPRYVSISIGRLASKSSHIVLLFSCGCVMLRRVVSRKSAGNVQSCALARASNSSSTPVMSGRTPTFSMSSAWFGVSKRILAGWKEIGLVHVRYATQGIGEYRTLSCAHIAVGECLARLCSRPVLSSKS